MMGRELRGMALATVTCVSIVRLWLQLCSTGDALLHHDALLVGTCGMLAYPANAGHCCVASHGPPSAQVTHITVPCKPRQSSMRHG